MQPQRNLLQGMIDSGIQAVLVKVAALGLVPQRHLGKTLQQMQPTLEQLNRQDAPHQAYNVLRLLEQPERESLKAEQLGCQTIYIYFIYSQEQARSVRGVLFLGGCLPKKQNGILPVTPRW